MCVRQWALGRGVGLRSGQDVAVLSVKTTTRQCRGVRRWRAAESAMLRKRQEQIPSAAGLTDQRTTLAEMLDRIQT